MAREAEDSEDEFPALARLLSRKNIFSATNSGFESRRPRATKNDAEQLNTDVRDDHTPRMKSVLGSTIKKNEDLGNAKPKPRKRLLGPTCDNPLLRPLASSSLGRGSSGSRSPSKWNSETPKEKLSAAQKAKGALSDLSSAEPECENGLRVKLAGRQGKSMKREVGKRLSEAPGREAAVDFESDEEDYGETSGLSDFVVDDSVFVDEDSIEALPPRSSRKLLQGRTRQTAIYDSVSEDLGRRMAKLRVDDDVLMRSKPSAKRDRELKDFARDYDDSDAAPRTKDVETSDRPSTRVTSRKTEGRTSDIDDSSTLTSSPSESKPNKASREMRFITPPGSPVLQPRRLQSPKKQLPRIPSTLHEPSMDSFWQQDVINDWNDEYSPQKVLRPGSKHLLQEQSSPKKSPIKQDRVARDAKKAFSVSKHALAEAFLIELDNEVTNGEIARLAATTGGVKIIWSKKLNTTAGRANWKRETIKSSAASENGEPIHRHHAAIELAEKVIDDEERLLNVLAHEFCHLANFMISNLRTNPHGKEFKAWAAKCSRHFGHRGIEVTTKHRYTIDYKYVWECVNCSAEFKRHSKSIDPTRHQCGSCKSMLVQTKPVPRANAGTTKVSEYQVFVKENMKRLREENPGSPQKEIMGLVGKEYQALKASRLGLGEEQSLGRVGIEVAIESRDGTPDDAVGPVVRKLDFLDLTSPRGG
ncbi:hypothetical protein PZA11_005005 [Diplocarpon coronariae]